MKLHNLKMFSKRIIAGIVLIIILFSLFIYSSLGHNTYDPDIEYILENFDNFNNSEITIGGKIKEINQLENKIYIKIGEKPYTDFEIDVRNISFEGNIGDAVEVFGTLESPSKLTAKKMIVVPPWKNTLIYVRSLPAIPFALYLFFRTWKFNKKTFRFERREDKDA